MRIAYPTFIVQDGKDYLVFVPDMDIYSEGSTFADAIVMARDAIGVTGVSMEDNGVEVPMPSSQQDALQKAGMNTDILDFSKGVLTFVDVDFLEYRKQLDNKTVRRNVTIPNWLNKEAEKAHINVSRVLQEALMAKLNIYR